MLSYFTIKGGPRTDVNGGASRIKLITIQQDTFLSSFLTSSSADQSGSETSNHSIIRNKSKCIWHFGLIIIMLISNSPIKTLQGPILFDNWKLRLVACDVDLNFFLVNPLRSVRGSWIQVYRLATGFKTIQCVFFLILIIKLLIYNLFGLSFRLSQSYPSGAHYRWKHSITEMSNAISLVLLG